jgi:hypothetical protein
VTDVSSTPAVLPAHVEAALERLGEKILAASLVVADPPAWLTVEEAASWISAKAYSTTARAVRELPVEKKYIAGKLRLNRRDLETYVGEIIDRAPSGGQANETALVALAEKRARKSDACSKATSTANDPEQGDGEECELTAAE